ncbi:GGDEF domain-containing protein [Methylomarinum vadi]|uniref:GGDEF domain-containing protein n=1 Tax=Methylomarinum vadi TaxID=438855 RepID=UPI0004DF18AE|nr:GGDEF domain-containing protein [Methylomarinum vadi]
MHTNPYIDDDVAKTYEFFRLTTALLAKYRIAPSPVNYRLGYDHVAGKNEELKSALNELIGQPDSLSSERLWELYQRFFNQDQNALEKIRLELRHIVMSVQNAFEQSGGNISDYAQTLSRFAEILDPATPIDSISSEVQKVYEETRSMEQMQRRLENNMSHLLTEVDLLRKELEQVKVESLTDSLTGISNRKAFDTTLEHTVIAAREQDITFCILVIDIDHFKKFNDTYGHLVGDKVLRFVASTLKRCLKGKDTVARFGGEEFTVILPQTKLNDAVTIAEQVRHAVSSGSLKDLKSGKRYGSITVSIGIAQFHKNELANDLLQRADEALYLAKDRGRNRVEKAV